MLRALSYGCLTCGRQAMGTRVTAAADRAAAAATRSTVLGLYRHCLRSAQRCPAQMHRETYLHYLQASFRHNAAVNDARFVKQKIEAASELVPGLQNSYSKTPLVHGVRFGVFMPLFNWIWVFMDAVGTRVCALAPHRRKLSDH